MNTLFTLLDQCALTEPLRASWGEHVCAVELRRHPLQEDADALRHLPTVGVDDGERQWRSYKLRQDRDERTGFWCNGNVIQDAFLAGDVMSRCSTRTQRARGCR